MKFMCTTSTSPTHKETDSKDLSIVFEKVFGAYIFVNAFLFAQTD